MPATSGPRWTCWHGKNAGTKGATLHAPRSVLGCAGQTLRGSADGGTFPASRRPQHRQGRLLSGLCSINRRLGYLDEALAYSRQAEQLFAAEGATVAHAMELASQAMIARMISDLTRAGELYDKALAVVRAAGEQDQYALSVLLNNYGVFLQTAGRLDEALEIHRECLAIREKRGDVRGMIDSFGNLADILGDSGRAEEGLQLREQLLAMPELQEADDVTARLVRLGRTRT